MKQFILFISNVHLLRVKVSNLLLAEKCFSQMKIITNGVKEIIRSIFVLLLCGIWHFYIVSICTRACSKLYFFLSYRIHKIYQEPLWPCKKKSEGVD
jgi:hypothetical protein